MKSICFHWKAPVLATMLLFGSFSTAFAMDPPRKEFLSDMFKIVANNADLKKLFEEAPVELTRHFQKCVPLLVTQSQEYAMKMIAEGFVKRINAFGLEEVVKILKMTDAMNFKQEAYFSVFHAFFKIGKEIRDQENFELAFEIKFRDFFENGDSLVGIETVAEICDREAKRLSKLPSKQLEKLRMDVNARISN